MLSNLLDNQGILQNTDVSSESLKGNIIQRMRIFLGNSLVDMCDALEQEVQILQFSFILGTRVHQRAAKTESM